ncbi:hypothetical protein B2I21_08675 [Chryseobacterium mucoviscidosis]|nr:hypothetical protein B2I21_08675 [Chryseobacterium mucoviscidosis]
MPGIDSYSLDNYGLDGSSVNLDEFKNYRTGTVTSSTGTVSFLDYNNITTSARSVLVDNLPFRPRLVVLTREALGTREVSTYSFNINRAVETPSGTNFNFCVYASNISGAQVEFIKVFEFTGSGSNTNGFVNDTSFRLPVIGSAVSYRWEMFG